MCAYNYSSGPGVVSDDNVGECFRNRITVVLMPCVTVVQDSVILYFV